MDIDFLCSRPQYAKTVARWIYDVFIVNKPGSGSYEKVCELFRSAGRTDYPITFIALSARDCIGTVSLVHNDLKSQSELTPWLAALYVRPAFRNLGVAKKLLSRACDAARQMEAEILYLKTEHASGYYKKLGWDFLLRTTDSCGAETEVFRYVL